MHMHMSSLTLISTTVADVCYVPARTGNGLGTRPRQNKCYARLAFIINMETVIGYGECPSLSKGVVAQKLHLKENRQVGKSTSRQAVDSTTRGFTRQLDIQRPLEP